MADQRDPKWTPGYTLVLSSLVALGYIGLVLYILWDLHGAYSVESTRLLLVLTLTIAMFGFGGLLIIRALFVDKEADKFQDRFRLAREIFLVFSGIFGTIIGFYFGTSDTEDKGASPAIEIAYTDGQVTAAVTGGAEPFIGIITKKDEAGGEMMTANKRTLTYSATPCPEAASLFIVDGRGRRAEGSVKCPAAGAGDTGGTNAADNSATNTNDNNAANSD
jgi:hypothetical protein